MSESESSLKRKKNKSWFKDKAKKSKGDWGGGGGGGRSKPGIELGNCGWILTCNRRERECLREGYQILNDILEEIQPKVEDDKNLPKHSDLEAVVESEIAQMKSNPSKGKAFQQVFSHCANIVFVKPNSELIPDCDPNHYTDVLFDKLKKTGRLASKNLLRFLPVLTTSKPTPEDISKALGEILESKRGFDDSIETFKVDGQVRNNTACKKQPLVDAAIKTVQEKCPDWTADLDSPDVTIGIDVLQKIACISLLKDFKERKKYNLIEFCKSHTKETSDD